MRFGISVYPEQESEQELEAYLRLAAKHGFTSVFTSMFSVDEPAPELLARFERLAALIHELGMTVTIDANPMLFEKVGATADNLEPFHRIGIDGIRMDMPYSDERNNQLLQNPYGITIEFSTMMFDMVDAAVDWEKAVGRMTTCHNFYPQRYTAASREAYLEMNRAWAGKNVPIEVFITSQNPDARGPWPVRDGLPTIEETRDMPVELQVRYIDLLGGADLVLLGNEPATEEEFEAIEHVMKAIEPVPGDPTDAGEFSIENLIKPRPGARRTLLHVELEPDVTELERKIMAFDNHVNGGDGTEYMLRSRMTRMLYRNDVIEPRPCDKDVFHRGDVLIVNDNLKHYAAELQIVLKDMKNDGQRNYIGRIAPSEQFLLDLIEPGIICTLEAAE